MRQFFLLIVLFLVFTCVLSAQTATEQKGRKGNAFVLGIVDTIQSEKLNETRVLNIYLPPGYSPDSATLYPVIYLLDGSAHEDFIHIAGLVQFLNMIEVLPESVVVGIANIDRKRDFTFPTTVAQDKKDFPTTGGSAKFIDFIEDELLPYINQRYKVSGLSTLIGQSLGGLLATEILLKRPYLFEQYLIVSPSLWWDSESLLKAAPKLLAQHPGDRRKVYISVGKEGKQMETDARKLFEVIQQWGKGEMKAKFLFMPEEDHRTILHNSVYKGLLLIK